VDKADDLAEEFLHATLRVEDHFNPALISAFSFDVVLERTADHTLACERTADEPVNQSCL
jgi:hypothetical protein